MKLLLYGKNARNIKGLVKSLGFEIVKDRPDVVVSYGGDGTLLASERQYPGIPKLPVRNSKFCKKCPKHEDKVVLKRLLQRKLDLRKHQKLHTDINGKNLYAVNDFIIRNTLPIHTIRFRATPLGKKLLIGDGVVIATPFGSTGYFQSITREVFTKGFGVALNNVTKETKPSYFAQDNEVGFQLIRGQAVLAYDNSAEIITIPEGQQLTFKLSDHVAGIYENTSLRCPNCRITR